jgi:hypothetical protein
MRMAEFKRKLDYLEKELFEQKKITRRFLVFEKSVLKDENGLMNQHKIIKTLKDKIDNLEVFYRLIIETN